MPITFNTLPVNMRVPGTYAEIDGTQAAANTPQVVPQRILLIGHAFAGTPAAAAPGVAVPTFDADHVAALAGLGSMLHQMARVARLAAPTVPLTILPIAPGNGSTAGSTAVTFGGPFTGAGTVDLHVGGRPYSVNVAPSGTVSTPAGLAASFMAAVNADPYRLAQATVAGAVLTLTARHAGADAGDIPVVVNRYGQALPAGGTVATVVTPGTGVPTVDATLLAGLGEHWYPTWAVPFTDQASLVAIVAELTSRWGPIRQNEGAALVVMRDTPANLLTRAGQLNSPLVALVDAAECLSPTWLAAACLAGVDAQDAQADPGRPRQTLPLPGLLATREGTGRTLLARNALLDGGVSTIIGKGRGQLAIERLVTTYRVDTNGVRDDAYFDTETVRVLASIRYDVRRTFGTKYPRHKLGVDGSLGANTMTPKMAKAEYVACGARWVDLGWIEGGAAFEAYQAGLQVEIDAADPNRLNALISPDIINGLRVNAVKVQFRQ